MVARSPDESRGGQAVDFNAEEQRCRVTQRKSEVLWGNGKYKNFSDRNSLFSAPLRLCVKKEPAPLPNLGLKIAHIKR